MHGAGGFVLPLRPPMPIALSCRGGWCAVSNRVRTHNRILKSLIHTASDRERAGTHTRSYAGPRCGFGYAKLARKIKTKAIFRQQYLALFHLCARLRPLRAYSSRTGVHSFDFFAAPLFPHPLSSPFPRIQPIFLLFSSRQTGHLTDAFHSPREKSEKITREVQKDYARSFPSSRVIFSNISRDFPAYQALLSQSIRAFCFSDVYDCDRFAAKNECLS